MRKFFALCVVMSLMFLFTIPALTADVNKVDLGSNLSFTFEPSSKAEKSLTIIPFANFNSSLLQEEPAEKIKKATSFSLVAFAFGMWLAGIIALSIS